MPREQVTEIVAEMVANVLSLAVAPGDPVAAGDTVVLLESMKMEIPVLVDAPGPHGRGGGIRTRGRSPYDRFQGGSDRPLRHPSSCPDRSPDTRAV